MEENVKKERTRRPYKKVKKEVSKEVKKTNKRIGKRKDKNNTIGRNSRNRQKSYSI